MPSRYRYVTLPLDHPIASSSGKVPLHRKVLWEKIGPGPHPCHWCRILVDWLPGHHTEAGALTTDHVDDDSQNNDPSNLVPSCHECNVTRARDKRFSDGLFVVNRQTGARERAVERTCLRAACGKAFLIPAKLARERTDGKSSGGRYCSRECMYARNR